MAAAAKADNIFVRAKAYVKAHPRSTFQEAIQKVKGKKKAVKKAAPAAKKAVHKKTAKQIAISGPRKKAAPKKAAAPVKREKVKIRIKKSAQPVISIGKVKSMSTDKLNNELKHQAGLLTAITKHAELLKIKGMTPKEKAAVRKDILAYKNLLQSSKKHVNALKKNL